MGLKSQQGNHKITGQGQTGAALEKSKEYFQALFDSMLEGVQILDYDWRYLYLNATAEKHNRRPNEELLGRKYMDIWPGVEDTHVFSLIEHCKEERVSSELENRFVFPDGAVGWFVLSIQPIPEGVLILSFDITEHKRVEEELRKSEEGYRFLFENNPHPMWVYDLKTLAFLAVNDAAVEKYGYTREEFLGMTIADIRPSEDVSRLMEIVAQRRPALQHSGEWRHRLKNGTVIDVEINSHTLQMGDRDAALVVAQDITERKRAQETVRDSQARLAGIIHSAMDAIISLDADQRVILFNPAAEQLFGCPAEQALGQSLDRFIPERFRASHNEYIRVFGLSNHSTRSMKALGPLTCLRANGQEFLAEITISQTEMAGQKIYTALLRDATERVRAEKALRESERQMQALVTSLDDIVFEFDEQGTYLNVWGTDESLLAKPKDQMLGRRIVDILGETNGRPFTEAVKRVITSGHPERIEYVLDVMGGRRWFVARISPIQSQDSSYRTVSMLIQNITERKQVEQALRESEMRFRSLIENSSDEISIVDADGKLLYETPSINPTLGYGPGEFLGQALFQLVHPDDLERIQDQFARLKQNPDLHPRDRFRLRHKDGTWRWVEAVGTNLLSEPGVRGIVINYHDITERVRAEDTILENERQMRALLTSLDDIVFELDEQATYLNIWTADDTLLAQPRAQLLGRRMEEVLGETIGRPFAEAAKRVLASGYPESIEYPLEVIGGHRWFLARISPILDRDHSWRTVSMLVRDITERKRAEAALLESEQRFRRLFTTSPDAVLLIDPHDPDLSWPIVDCNEAACRMNGYAREELIGQSIDILNITTGTREERITYLDHLRCEDVVHGETLHRHKDGHVFLIEVSTSLINFDGRELVMGIDRDITERKRAEEALRESEARFRAMSDYSPIGIFLTAPDGSSLYANAVNLRQMGLTAEEAMGNGWQQAIHLDDREEVFGKFADAVRRGVAYESVNRYLRTDGTVVWVEVNMSSIFNGEKIFGFLGTVVDITERKQAEEALRESETRYRLATQATNDVIWEWNAKTHELLWTENAQLVFGYLPEEIGPGEKWWDEHIHPEDRERIISKMDALLTGNETTWSDEYRFRRRDGSYAYISDRAYIERNTTGEAIRMVGAMSDITERKQAEDALQQSERKFRTLFEIAPVGISVTDTEHNIIDANYALQRITGLGQQELLGGTYRKRTYLRPDGSVMPPEEFASARAICEEMPIFDIETGIVTEDRGVIWTQVSATPLQASDSTVVVITQDITERVQAEREIRQRTEDLLIINTLNEAVNRGEDIDRIIEVFARETRNVFACNGVSIYLLDPDAKYIELQNTTISRKLREKIEKLIGWPIPKIRIPVRESSFFQKIMANEQGLMTSDPKVIQGWLEEFTETTFLPPLMRPAIRKIIPQIYKVLNINSTISIPLVSSGRTIGILDMSSEGQFTEEDLRRIRSISHQVTEVLMRKQVERQVQLQLRRLGALSEIDRAISSSLDMRLSLDILLSEVLSQLGVDATAILLLNESNLTLEYFAGKGFHTLGIHKSRMRLGEGLGGQVGWERKLLHVPNLPEADPLFARVDLLKDEGFIEYFGIPLIAKGMLKGVLEVFHRTPLNPDIEWTNYLETLGGQAAIAIDNAQMFEGIQLSNMELIAAYDATIAGWSHAMDLRDKETEGHSQRVTELTLMLAEKLGISQQEQVHIRRGALLHDMGKLGVPDHILLKPGKLTEEEWVCMRRHPTYALEMLMPISYLRPALDIPYCHHEKWDGTGYPRGLKGEQIPLAARIFAVVDVWDALTSDRPYRPAWTGEKALEYIKEQSGHHFDPNVVDVFLETIGSD